MKDNLFSGYYIADLKEEDLKNIAELEKSISYKTDKDVVLIAYQHNNKAEE